MSHHTAALLFWISGLLLFYTFAGYALLFRILAGRRPPHTPPIEAASYFPRIAVIVVAYNEASRIARRIENLRAAQYPRERIHIIVVSDGSTDDTPTLARQAGAHVIEQPARLGKPAGLNTAFATLSDEEIVVLADARQAFEPDAIPTLLAHFADPAIGAVSGELLIAGADSATGAGMDAYWKIERRLRADEARLDSCIGCTGAIYALRRSLFKPIPADTILDDLLIPMNAATAGARILHEPAAIARDPQPLEPAAETRRKRRTLAGNYQLFFRHPGWLLPWRNRLALQLISHKYLRLLGPWLLAVALLANLFLLHSHFYQFTLAAQLGFYTCALAGRRLPGPLRRIGSLAAGFTFLNLTAALALWHYLTTADPSRWTVGKK